MHLPPRTRFSHAPYVDSLVETLRAQHRELETLTAHLTTVLHGDDVAQVETALQAFRAALLHHLTLEDDALYPRLLALGFADRTDSRTIRTFTDTMKRVSESLKSFLERSVTDLTSLRRDWAEVEHLHASRMQTEERVLFPMYEERSKSIAK